ADLLALGVGERGPAGLQPEEDDGRAPAELAPADVAKLRERPLGARHRRTRYSPRDRGRLVHGRLIHPLGGVAWTQPGARERQPPSSRMRRPSAKECEDRREPPAPAPVFPAPAEAAQRLTRRTERRVRGDPETPQAG